MEIRSVKDFYCIYMITMLSVCRNTKNVIFMGLDGFFVHLQWKTSNRNRNKFSQTITGMRIFYSFPPLVHLEFSTHDKMMQNN